MILFILVNFFKEMLLDEGFVLVWITLFIERAQMVIKVPLKIVK